MRMARFWRHTDEGTEPARSAVPCPSSDLGAHASYLWPEERGYGYDEPVAVVLPKSVRRPSAFPPGKAWRTWRMAPTVRASDELLALDLAPRAYNALRRNNVREVGELVSLSASSFFA
jgi:hypothetical protein